ncbi:unnamed protein product, partial [Cyprideis torosa]
MASERLIKAVSLDKCGRLPDALHHYEVGLEMLLKEAQQETDTRRKKHLQERAQEFLGRAEALKRRITQRASFHEHLQIKDGEKGKSYLSVFGRFMDKEVEEVSVEDAYIRSKHQLYNLLRLCELCVRNCSPALKSIKVTTTKCPQSPEFQQKTLETIRRSLAEQNVTLDWKYSDVLHDREIRLNTGLVIKIGRGLDYFYAPKDQFSIGACDLDLRAYYFYAPKDQFSIGACDLDLRACRETTVDVYYDDQPTELSS